jgi:hypothetical protein
MHMRIPKTELLVVKAMPKNEGRPHTPLNQKEARTQIEEIEGTGELIPITQTTDMRVTGEARAVLWSFVPEIL